MLLDIFCPISEHSHPLGDVCDQETFYQRLGISVHILREFDLPIQDVLVDDHGVLVGEGIYPGVHLIDEDPESPPVDSFAVAQVHNDLGSQVLWSAAQGIGLVLDDLGEAEVGELEVSIFGKQKVLWFQIPVDNVLFVDVFENEDYLGGEESESLIKYAA